ncbi:hypothetical protein tb265_04790 [Gemmatimonadetes bacterium T265]|nr:hypothetical protein tb265_04790 [Gemmatimonadetes bacterium T265]
MPDPRLARITGANRGVRFHVAKALAARGATVLLGSRDLARGEAAAQAIGPGAIALQLDVTDRASIAAAAERVGSEFGRLDLLVINAAISNTRKQQLGPSLQEYAKLSLASNAALESVEDGAREVVRVALLGPAGPSGTFTRWENTTIPW